MTETWIFGSSRALIAAALLLCSLSAASAYTAEEQQACTNDAFRLCSSAIPDVDRVTACMVQHKAELSPGCRAQFGPPPKATRVVARSTKVKKKPKRLPNLR